MARRPSNKIPQCVVKKMSNILGCNSKAVLQSVKFTSEGRYDEVWRLLEKGRNCAGELTNCCCNKLHLDDICESVLFCEYGHTHVMAKKCIVKMQPYFFGSMPNRKLIWSNVAYRFLVSEFRTSMTNQAYIYYEFSFPEGLGTFQSSFLPHSKLTPTYLAKTVFPDSLDDSLLVEPFYATVIVINMDKLERNEASSYLAEVLHHIKSLDCKVMPVLQKSVVRHLENKYASHQTKYALPMKKKIAELKAAGLKVPAGIMSIPPPHEMMAIATSQREYLEAMRKKEFTVPQMIDTIEDLAWHDFGPAKYKKQEVTLASDVISKLKTHKRWYCEVATSLLAMLATDNINSYTKLYCYQIRFSNARTYSSQLKELAEHEPSKDWQIIFPNRKCDSLPLQFELSMYAVDTTFLGQEYRQAPLVAKELVDDMKSIIQTQKYATGDPFQPSWQKTIQSEGTILEEEAVSAFCNIENAADYIFSAEDFKYKTKMAKKAKASPIYVSSAYRILFWDVKPQTSRSVRKCFSVEFDQKFLEHTKDQKKVIALVCCDIVMGNGISLPNGEQAICIRLTSGHDILTAIVVVTTELILEDVMDQMFEKCQSDFSVMRKVDIEVEWRTLN